MIRTLNGLLRIGITLFVFLRSFNFDYRPDFSAHLYEQIGEIIGILFIIYLLFTFGGHHMTQGILEIQKKEIRKIRYLTISGIFGTVIHLGIYIYKMIISFIETGLDRISGMYFLLACGLAYLIYKDWNIIRLKENPERLRSKNVI